MYSKCGYLGYARKVFDEMPETDVVSWTNMISGYSNVRRVIESRVLFERMGLEGVESNEFTWNALIGGYARVGDCVEAFSLFRKMSGAGLVPDVATWNAMICGFVQSENQGVDCLGTCWSRVDFFKSMRESQRVEIREEHYGCVIDMLCRSGKIEEAYDLVHELDTEVMDSMVGSS
ncbi:pentatricopeptide repeat-containing protein [Tanacetum coccineum]